MVKVAKPHNILVNYNELILHILRYHSLCPREIADLVRELLGDDSIMESSVRYRLARLEENQLVTYEKLSGSGQYSKGAKRYYSLTTRGGDALNSYEEIKDLIVDVSDASELMSDSNISYP